MKTLISIVGPTGIGKTSLSLDAAEHFATEIISCDSRQFFAEMPIGTAAPSAAEQKRVTHHFVGHLNVTDFYSIGQYEKEALKKLEELFLKHDQVVLVGGSMMYEKAVIEGLHDLPEASVENQERLSRILETEGIEKLQEMLLQADPAYFSVVDRHNPRRLLRALDVIWQKGRPYSEFIAAPLPKRDFQVVRVGISAPRDIIYDRINQRVDKMMEGGLLAEVENLMPYQTQTALQTVGYAELFRYLSGEWTLDFAIEEIKKNSRRFAKRQLTWYRKEENIHWLGYQQPFQEFLSLMETLKI